ncbi:unnamed protein product [Dicrocoelium dendriticum]|nr:unnamed protein product [Dicrocoelium dendriticum]
MSSKFHVSDSVETSKPTPKDSGIISDPNQIAQSAPITSEPSISFDNATHITIQLPDGMQESTLSQQQLCDLVLQLSQSGQMDHREYRKIVTDVRVLLTWSPL